MFSDDNLLLEESLIKGNNDCMGIFKCCGEEGGDGNFSDKGGVRTFNLKWDLQQNISLSFADILEQFYPYNPLK